MTVNTTSTATNHNHHNTQHHEHQSVAHLRFKLEDQVSFLSDDSETFDSIDYSTSTDDLEGTPWLRQPLIVVVLGASGDLAKKKTYPSLFELFQHSLLPPNTVIWGYARSPKSNPEFREHLKHHLKGPGLDQFLDLCFYCNGNSYGDIEAYGRMLHEISTSFPGTAMANTLYYFAIPPNVFADTVKALQNIPGAVKEGKSRLVIEKPFGRDTKSCQELLDHFSAIPETMQYRLDHYLAKPMVESLATLRQANPWLEALWSYQHVQSVHIRFKEPFGTQGRGGYFDQFNIIRDVLQNHLLQVLLLVAMELPEHNDDDTDNKDAFRQAKIAVLQQMPPILLQDALLGQYDGYKDDPTITNKDTVCPTYAALRCFVNNDRWKGVPFILEAGKAMDDKVVDVQIQFKNRPPFPSNTLTMEIQPEAKLSMETHFKPIDSTSRATVTTMPLTAHYTPESSDIIENAYTRLLWDVIQGSSQNFVRADELVKSWQVFTPLLDQLERDHIQPEAYSYGSEGPSSRADFLKEMMGGTKAAL